MKRIFNVLLFAILLSNFCAFAQVREIEFNPYNKNFIPQIKVEDNKLFLTHDNGIFYRDYSSGEVPDDWGEPRHPWKLLAFPDKDISDFVINGDKILGLSSSNSIESGKLFIRSLDGGKTFEEFTPLSLIEPLKYHYNIQPRFLIQNPANKDELIMSFFCLFHSKNFGETWEILTNECNLNMYVEYSCRVQQQMQN